MGALEIIQEASTAIGLPKPSTIQSTSDAQALRMLSLVNRLGRSLNREFDWQVNVKRTNFTTNGSTEYLISGAPVNVTDFSYLTVPYLYNRTENRVIAGQTADSYQLRQLYGITTIRNRFRILNNKFIFEPTLATGLDIHFEYKSTDWVVGDKSAFTADADIPLLNEELLILGLIWRYKNELGLTYDEEKLEYELFKNKLQAQDKDRDRHIYFGGGVNYYPNIPDSFDGYTGP